MKNSQKLSSKTSSETGLVLKFQNYRCRSFRNPFEFSVHTEKGKKVLLAHHVTEDDERLHRHDCDKRGLIRFLLVILLRDHSGFSYIPYFKTHRLVTSKLKKSLRGHVSPDSVGVNGVYLNMTLFVLMVLIISFSQSTRGFQSRKNGCYCIFCGRR
jgi:hypothetical protein